MKKSKQDAYDDASNAGCCEGVLDYDILPDACTNDLREESLIRTQQESRAPNSGKSPMERFIERESNLLLACTVLVIALNISQGRIFLYPFMIFSTWVHEMCHGLAAILMGGSIAKLQIFKDGSGLAYTYTESGWKRGFVASGGYPGTATVGCLLLLFRRTTLGPTIGTIGMGIAILLSCALWVRNSWGLVALSLEGVALLLLGWKLPATTLDILYNFLAAACSLNAFTSIRDLFAGGDYYVGGEVITTSDAHTVADNWGFDYRFWATVWMMLSLFLTVLGIVFAFDAKATYWFKPVLIEEDPNYVVQQRQARRQQQQQKQQQQQQQTSDIQYAVPVDPAVTGEQPKKKRWNLFRKPKN